MLVFFAAGLEVNDRGAQREDAGAGRFIGGFDHDAQLGLQAGPGFQREIGALQADVADRRFFLERLTVFGVTGDDGDKAQAAAQARRDSRMATSTPRSLSEMDIPSEAAQVAGNS